LSIVAEGLPLAPLEPWLARVVPGARLTGEASPDLEVAWRAARAENVSGVDVVAARGKVGATHVRFTSSALNGDLLELATVAANLNAELNGHRLTAQGCTLQGDWIQAELNGQFDLDEIGQLSLKSLPTSDATVTARVELPKLTTMLPRTLRLRPGVRIDAGSMEDRGRFGGPNRSKSWWTRSTRRPARSCNRPYSIQRSPAARPTARRADSRGSFSST
jgi:translocation and assembly module TamB